MSQAIESGRVRLATSADRPAWDALIAARPEADPLQAWAWGEVTGRHGERPLRLVHETDDGLVGIAQVLLRATTGGRTVGYVPHGPIWRRDRPADVPLLLAAIRDAARVERAIVVKVDPRAVVDGDTAKIAATLRDAGLRPARFDLQAPTTRIVDLSGGSDGIWGRWEPDARTRVRRAAKEGVVTWVDRTGDPAAVAALAWLHAGTAERADFRARSAPFLSDAAAAFAPSGGWLAVEARLEDQPVAAMGFLRVGDRAAYLWGGSSRDTLAERSRAQYAVLAAAMDALAADGVATLDLWGVVEADDETAHPEAAGYSRFKRKFGGRQVRHPGTFDLVIDPVWFRLRDVRERLRGG
ncbi:MAG TPA: peptidoglycan bridge formation glycyltransferase FemA/FemB family protein [Candidatus Saccharimonadia bacterium]|nr:peptidoglycan bridge formation glycyltransferase FemA/FemB family protein [Candidatus Saccharimonadia bacterium]